MLDNEISAAKFLLKDGSISDHMVWGQEVGIIFYEDIDTLLYLPFPIKLPYVGKEKVTKEQLPEKKYITCLQNNADIVNTALLQMGLRSSCLNGNILSMAWTSSKYDKILECSYAKYYHVMIKKIKK